MRIGFASVYSFRPHVEQLYYLARLLQEGGHNTFALTCDASVKHCYGALLRGRGKIVECPRCILGGVRSYHFGPIDSVSGLVGNLSLSEERALTLALSSSATLRRTETPADLEAPATVNVRRLLVPGIQKFYSAARYWIQKRQLDAVLGFNGRMDLTAAIWEAARDEGVRYISVERTWFGHGIQLLPEENCLGTRWVHVFARRYRELPLTKSQAVSAASHIARRLSRQNHEEWRVYNVDATRVNWPGSDKGFRALIIPSSRNEFEGHPDWTSEWPGGTTQALDQLIESYGLQPDNCVIRAHPNWSEKIGVASGELSTQHYRSWAARRGVVFVAPDSSADTYDLLRQTDIAVLNGGSTALEAVALGKRVFLLGEAKYSQAGIAVLLSKPSDFDSAPPIDECFSPTENVQRMLRFLYCQMARMPQFTSYVRASDPTHYRYFSGEKVERIERLIRSGELEADDSQTAGSDACERSVALQVLNRDWNGVLAVDQEPKPIHEPLSIRRRLGLRWLDQVRYALPRGDRG